MKEATDKRVDKIFNSTKPQYVKKRSQVKFLQQDLKSSALLYDISSLSCTKLHAFRQQLEYDKNYQTKFVKNSLLQLTRNENSKGTLLVYPISKLSAVEDLEPLGAEITYYKEGDICDEPLKVGPLQTNLRIGKDYPLIQSHVPVKLVKGFITVAKEVTILEQGATVTSEIAKLLRVLKLPLKKIAPKLSAYLTSRGALDGTVVKGLKDPLTVKDVKSIMCHVAKDNLAVYLTDSFEQYAIIRLLMVAMMSNIDKKHQHSNVLLGVILQLLADKRFNIPRAQSKQLISKRTGLAQSIVEQLMDLYPESVLQSYLDLSAEVSLTASKPVEEKETKTVAAPEPEAKKELTVDLSALF